jgi:hypothetical protein
VHEKTRQWVALESSTVLQTLNKIPWMEYETFELLKFKNCKRLFNLIGCKISNSSSLIQIGQRSFYNQTPKSRDLLEGFS